MDRTGMRTALRLLAWGPASLLVQWPAARLAGLDGWPVVLGLTVAGAVLASGSELIAWKLRGRDITGPLTPGLRRVLPGLR